MSAIVMEGVVLVGDVRLGENAGIWYNSVLRADLGPITIGANSNIQDGCILHVDEGSSITVGESVTVGHACILHGCTVRDGAFVGMGSTVMENAVLEAGSMLGAGSLLTQGTVVPAGMLAVGRPAKVKRPLTPEELAANRAHADHYAALAKDPVQRHK